MMKNIRQAEIEYRSYLALFIFIFDSQRQMIVQKQRLKEAILSNSIYTMNQKMKKKKQKSILPFQRNKEQLLKEILEQYSRNIKKSEKNSTPVFIVSQIQSQYSEKYNDYLSNKPKYEISDEIGQQSQSKQSVQIQYLNQYFSKPTKEVNRLHITKEIDIAVNSQDHYDLIDNFIQIGNNQRIRINTQPQVKIAVSLKADSKSFNQSTMALSKFYKTQHSPRRIIRKTEEHSHFKSRIKHQYIADERDKSQYSQKQQPIFKSGLLKDKQHTPNSKQKQFIGHISHSKINRTINEYSSSLFSLSQNQVRQQFTQRSSNKKSSIISVQQNRQSMSNSQVISIDLTDKLKQKSIKKVYIDLDVKQRPLEEIVEATENINSFSELEKYVPYNYDQERNIFDQIPQKKKVDLNEIKKSFQGFKNQFKIKDEQKFKKQIEQSKIRQKNTPKNMNKAQSQKQKLFNGQIDKNYELFLSKSTKKPISTQEGLFDVQQFEQLMDKEQKIAQQNSGIFDFLKRKVTKLHEEKKKSKSQTKKTFEKNDKIVVIPTVENRKGLNHDAELRPQLSQSSSCSFLKEKEEFNEDGVRKVSRIVSQSIRIVNQNLDKIDGKDSRVSQQHKQKKIDQQIKMNFSKKWQQIQQDQQKKATFQKLFGTNTKFKETQEANLINNFFGNHDNSHTFSDIQSHPSTVQKIDERSDDKSQVMKNLQDLRDYSIAADLFNKNNDILEKKSLPPSDQKQKPLKKTVSQIAQIDEPLNLFKQFQVKQQQKKSKHIQINLLQLKNLGVMQMSQDALSLSKFASASYDVNQDISIPSFKMHNSKSKAYQHTSKIQSNPKRIEISIDLASQFQNQSNLQSQKHDESSDSQADINALQDYQSDQQGQNNQKAVKNEVKVTKLAPVVEQDLEQSQFRKNKDLKFSLHKKQTNKSQKSGQPLIKKVVSELSSEVLRKNSQSENIELEFSKENSHRHSQKDKKKLKITLKSNASNEEHKLSSRNQEASLSLHSLADETQKNFINGLKNDLSNLKSKIQSSIIYDKGDLSKILSFNSQQKKSNSNNSKIINIQLSNLIAPSSKNGSKIFKQKSLKQEKFQIANLNANKMDSKSIDFDQINASISEQSFFQNFKDDFAKLKKKIQIDAGIPDKNLH